MNDSKHQTYGYVRVSSFDQNEVRQMNALMQENIHPTHIYMDKLSGKDFNRPQYQKMIHELQHGDLLCIVSIDRLGRNYNEILNQWRFLTKEIGVDIRVLDMPLLNTQQSRDLLGTFVADLVLQVLSFVAHNERDNLRKRQSEGIAAAKARGVHMGRPRKSVPSNFSDIVRQWKEKQITLQQVLDSCDMSESTFYKKLREYKLQQR